MSNVIQFPKHNKRLPNISAFRDKMEKAIANGDIAKATALEAGNMFASLLIEHLAIAGFDLSEEDNTKDLAMVIIALKSYIMKHYGLHHPVQNLSQELFVYRKDGDILLKTSMITRLVQG
jgi:hypothetical protein